MNLTDNLFGLGLIAVGIVVILTLGLYGRSIYQEQRASLMLTQLVQAVTSTYQSTRDYGTGSLIETLDGFGRLPEEFVVRSGGTITLEHPWGGGVIVNGGPGGETNQFPYPVQRSGRRHLCGDRGTLGREIARSDRARRGSHQRHGHDAAVYRRSRCDPVQCRGR